MTPRTRVPPDFAWRHRGSRRPGAVPRVDLLSPVVSFGGGAHAHSLVMACQAKQVRLVDTVHMSDRDRPPAVRL